jgi:hypothetical protein
LSTCSNAGIKFGLSGTAVDWGSAADACTIGTWVCTEAERGLAACDTARPNLASDYANCTGAGVDSNSNQHIGWLADRGTGNASGRWVAEDGSNDSAAPCFSLPVWCCWD